MAVEFTDKLPMEPEGLTPDWFSYALGSTVTSVSTRDTVWGTATKVLVDLEYADQPAGLPKALCVKGGFDEQLRSFGDNPAYRLEAQFFGEIADKLPIRLPGIYYSGVDEESNQGVVLMDNLADQDGRFGDPCHPFTRDEVAAGLETQAKWHAATAAAPQAVAEWLSTGSAPVRTMGRFMLSDGYWTHHFGQESSPKLPDSINDSGTLLTAFESLWAYEDGQPGMLVHGDAHLGNTYLWADGSVMFIDWQGVCVGPWSYDVAYFITGALTVEDRRAHERDLLDHYRSVLAAEGGPELSADDAWNGYRRHALHGFLWATTPPVMQTPERVRCMAERHCTAIEDLETLAALA